MKNITIRDILRVTEGELVIMGLKESADGSADRDAEEDKREEVLDRLVTDLCIDSREIRKGDLFVPLLGEKVDAHKFIPNVMPVAAATLSDWDISAVYADPEQQKAAEDRGDVLIRVKNTQNALEKIGAYIRTQYEPTVIGVTGSVGKTTTRRMIATALGSCREVYETPKNYNSKIGIPITTSRMLDEPSEIAVLEMGIDRIGEMDLEVSIVRPEIAVVTVIGLCHMEYLGSQEGIRREKLKIAGPDTILFLNADDPLLREVKGRTNAKETWYYGLAEDADYRAEDLVPGKDGFSFTYVHDSVKVPVHLPVLGEHNVRNALVAMAICDYLGMDLKAAAAAFADFEGLRQIIRHTEAGTVVIDDTYNASPQSMNAALSVLSQYDTRGERWAVLGDMFELGPDEKLYHEQVGENFPSFKVDHLITVGPLAGALGEKAKAARTEMDYKAFPTIEDAADYLEKALKAEDAVLLKASHGMHFDEIVKRLVPENK